MDKFKKQKFLVTSIFFAWFIFLPFNIQANQPDLLTEIFHHPCGIAVNEAGEIYVISTGEDLVKKYSGTYQFVCSFGGTGNGAGQFSQPQGIATYKNLIFIVDTGNDRVQKFRDNGNSVEFVSIFNLQQFYYPRDITIDDTGNLYVLDSGNHRILKLDINGKPINFSMLGTNILGEFGTGQGQFSNPYGIDADASGNIYVADSRNNRIQIFSSIGHFLKEFGTQGSNYGQMFEPQDVAVDKEGNIFVADMYNSRIQKFNLNGRYIQSFGTFGHEKGKFFTPQKLKIDRNKRLYIVDSNNNNVQVFDVSIYFTDVYASPTAFSPNDDGIVDVAFINYTIRENTKISIDIYNKNKNLVKNLCSDAERTKGQQQELWDGRDNTGAFVTEGVYTFIIRARNALNYQPSPKGGVVTVDFSQPLGSVSIRNDAVYATQNTILNLFASDVLSSVDTMVISNYSNFSTAETLVYNSIQNWLLLPGEGTREVFVKYIDIAGNVSPIYSDDVILAKI